MESKNMPSVQMMFNLKCFVRHDAEAAVFVSHCPALGVYSQGKDRDEALEAIKSAVSLYVASAYDFDRLDQILRRSGFKSVPTGSEPPEMSEFIAVQPEDAQEIDISVPLTLLASRNRSECLQ
jgi:predicted RNase H-like HicB family nuclease